MHPRFQVGKPRLGRARPPCPLLPGLSWLTEPPTSTWSTLALPAPSSGPALAPPCWELPGSSSLLPFQGPGHTPFSRKPP